MSRGFRQIDGNTIQNENGLKSLYNDNEKSAQRDTNTACARWL